MSADVLMPQLGFAMEEGKLLEWLVPDGARVEASTPIYSLEADKAVEEIEAGQAGTLRISAAAGEIYPVGACLAKIE